MGHIRAVGGHPLRHRPAMAKDRDPLSLTSSCDEL